MNYAKKMVLVEPRQLEKYKETMVDKTLSKLDGELYEILQRNISDDEKAKLYSSSLSRYLNIDKPNVVTKFDDDDDDAVKEMKKSTDVETLVLDSVPKKWKRQASRLLTHIKNNPDVGWSEKGELVVKNTVVSKTHVVDLINDLMRKRTSARTPNGWKRFADALRDHNIPHELIGNEDRWNYINESVDSGEPVVPIPVRRSIVSRKSTTSNVGRKTLGKRMNWELY